MKRFLQISAGILIGVLLNFAFSRLVHFLQLPFFFDTIGTLSVTFVFGALPGLICSAIYQFLASVVICQGRMLNMIYMLTVWGAIGIIALFGSSLKNSKSPFSTIIILSIISVLMIIEVSVLGGIINSIVDFYTRAYELLPDPSFSSDYYKIDLIKSGLSALPANIIARLPGNIVERPVSVFIAWTVAIVWNKMRTPHLREG